MSEQVIVEVALNGSTDPSLNPNVPVTPEQIASDALACMEAGASIIHNHIADYRLTGAAAAEAYAAGWRTILAARPDALLCPTSAPGATIEDRLAHLPPVANSGARMGVLDPGSVNLASHGPDGLPGSKRRAYINSDDDIEATVAELAHCRLGPSIAIYEPGFLRRTIALHWAGRLPVGAMIKLYFGGQFNWFDGCRSPVTFGLPPTRLALEAYLEMLEGSGLPWAVAVIGGDVVETGMARHALERGGHVRIGLEDFRGDRTPGNLTLLHELLDVCRAVGRAPATPTAAADILGLPERLTRL